MQFSNEWFNKSEIKSNIHKFLDKTKINKILEIGSYEGAFSCFISDNYLDSVGSILICVDPFDIKATKQAVEELLSNDKLAEEMGLNGRDAVLKQFNWEIEEKKLINIYRSIIK